MAAQHLTVTLTGTAVNLFAQLYPGVSPTDGRDVAYRGLRIQGVAANAVAYLGAAQGTTVTAADYGLMIPATSVAIIDLGDFFGGPFRLSDLVILGTAGNVFHLFGVLN